MEAEPPAGGGGGGCSAGGQPMAMVVPSASQPLDGRSWARPKVVSGGW